MEEIKELSPEQKLNAEQNEIEALIDAGISFKVGKRTFIMKQPFYGTLDRLANIFIKMEVDMTRLNDEGMLEAKRMAGKYSKLAAEAIAVSVLRSKWRIRLLRRPLTQYFLWSLTPSVMHDLAKNLNTMLNLEDFTHSTLLMSASRTTMPNKVEGNNEA